jgi:hypothetical protein
VHRAGSRHAAAMITKTFFMAKTFRAPSTNCLRHEKSFHDLFRSLGRLLLVERLGRGGAATDGPG